MYLFVYFVVWTFFSTFFKRYVMKNNFKGKCTFSINCEESWADLWSRNGAGEGLTLDVSCWTACLHASVGFKLSSFLRPDVSESTRMQCSCLVEAVLDFSAEATKLLFKPVSLVLMADPSSCHACTLPFVAKMLTGFLFPQAAMCYVHVAALVAEYLHRKSKFKLKFKTLSPIPVTRHQTVCEGFIKACYVFLNLLHTLQELHVFSRAVKKNSWFSPGHFMRNTSAELLGRPCRDWLFHTTFSTLGWTRCFFCPLSWSGERE